MIQKKLKNLLLTTMKLYKINEVIFQAMKYFLLISLASSLLLVSCSKKESTPPSNKALNIVPEVSVIPVKETSIPMVTKLSGRLESNKKSEVRARVAGVIKKRYFKEGMYVKAGQNLYLLDDAPMQANYNKAQAKFNKLSKELKRKAPLVASKAISKQEFDATEQAYTDAKYDLENAKINLTYAHITAPISGLIGASQVTEGDLVGHNGATLLTTIQDNSIMKVDLYQSAQDVMLIRKLIAEGIIEIVNKVPEVVISFEDDSVYPLKGKLFFTDNKIDETTGQILLKAEIPNPDNILLPGLVVNVKINQGNFNNIFVLPKQTVFNQFPIPDTDDIYADVIFVAANQDSAFILKPVKIIREINDFWVIKSDLKTNELVLFEGFLGKLEYAKKFNIKLNMNPIPNPAENQKFF